MKKVLEPMKSFCGMQDMLGISEPFGTCVHMADLAVLDYFKIRNLEFIYNLHFVYKFMETNRVGDPAFGLDNFSYEDRELVLKRLGLDVVATHLKFDLLVNNLRESIMKNRPVFLLVDLFYQKGRHFYYNNEHGGHVCVVYGFDDENQLVYTLDNYDGYKTYMVSYDMIVQYCKGLFEYLDDFKKDTRYFREYVLNGTQPKFDDDYVDSIIRKYVNNSLSTIDEKLIGLSKIKTLNERLEDLMCLKSFEGNLVSVKYKRGSESFMIKNLYQYNIFDKAVQEEIDTKLNEILKNWILVRSIVLRFNKTNKDLDEKCKKIRKILDTIYEDEIIYNDLLYSQFRKFVG